MEQTDTRFPEPKRKLPAGLLAAGVIALIVVVLLVVALAGEPAMPPQVGELVPEFQLTAFDGSPMVLSSQRGKVVVVNFFASWCGPCRQEAADLEQSWQDHQARGVQFFGIGYKDAAQNVKRFLAEFEVTYPATTEGNNSTARAYGVTGAPETFIIDSSGRLVRHILGPVGQAELAHELDRLLNP